MKDFENLTLELVFVFIVPGILLACSFLLMFRIFFSDKIMLISFVDRNFGLLLFLTLSFALGYLIDATGHSIFDGEVLRTERKLYRKHGILKEVVPKETPIDKKKREEEESKTCDKIAAEFDKKISEHIYARSRTEFLYYEASRNFFLIWGFFVGILGLYFWKWPILCLWIFYFPLRIYRKKSIENFYFYYVRFKISSRIK